VENTLNLLRNGAVGFIGWLGLDGTLSDDQSLWVGCVSRHARDTPGTLFAFDGESDGTCCVSDAVVRPAIDEDAVSPIDIDSVNWERPALIADTALLDKFDRGLNIGCRDSIGVAINSRSSGSAGCENDQRGNQG
jgi:hypothetical protein